MSLSLHDKHVTASPPQGQLSLSPTGPKCFSVGVTCWQKSLLRYIKVAYVDDMRPIGTYLTQDIGA